LAKDNCNTADSPTNAESVKVTGTNPNAVMVVGAAFGTEGPCTFFAHGDAAVQVSDPVTPLARGQNGFSQGRILGQHDAARRRFGPAAGQFANAMPQDPAAWSGVNFFGGATVTAGQAAPNGSLSAGKLTVASGADVKEFAFGIGIVVPVGDYFIFGG
jgi:hypothetical protein